jgi:hypothetical protein
MKRIFLGVSALILGAATWGAAQSLEDLNIQIHGYATQGFLYTTQNNFFTMNTSSGSPDWTEAVINVGANPMSKLRIGVQARYELLGNYANGITLDWAQADYKASDRLGVRFGKVKVPSGLFNETQDIDPSYMFALLPQSVYPLSSRNGQLSTFGGVAYGSLNEFSKTLGKLDYRVWGGGVSLPPNDGYFLNFNEGGITLPNGLSFLSGGGALRWRTPLPGLMIGSSLLYRGLGRNSLLAGGAIPGTVTNTGGYQPDFFGRFDWRRLMVAAEYTRDASGFGVQITGAPPSPPAPYDLRQMYFMATYKLTQKFSAGLYDSQYFSRNTPLGPARYSKDWTVGGRYDFNQYIYAKAEEHFIDGTAIGYDVTLNPMGLKPDTRLTVLKIGVSF